MVKKTPFKPMPLRTIAYQKVSHLRKMPLPMQTSGIIYGIVVLMQQIGNLWKLLPKLRSCFGESRPTFENQ
jgi:hypothetical protein